MFLAFCISLVSFRVYIISLLHVCLIVLYTYYGQLLVHLGLYALLHMRYSVLCIVLMTN